MIETGDTLGADALGILVTVAAATQSDGLLTNSRACVPGSMLLNVMTGMAIDGNEPIDSAPDDAPGTALRPYADGSTDLWSWDGTPGSSTSYGPPL